ncbi:HD domain-containing protein [Oceanibaculum indicum]|nr:HD domain-containing protein [Oceanibaculum indicum]
MAIIIAASVHENQVDKAGAPYILHPLRVMLAMQAEKDRIVAVLHDTVEDGPPDTMEVVKRWFPDAEIVLAVEALTRRPGEAYTDFIARVKLNPMATRVKLADIADNLCPSRAASLPDSLRQRYEAARLQLQGA